MTFAIELHPLVLVFIGLGVVQIGAVVYAICAGVFRRQT